MMVKGQGHGWWVRSVNDNCCVELFVHLFICCEFYRAAVMMLCNLEQLLQHCGVAGDNGHHI